MMVRSKDGENWTKEPELIYAHPFGGSQDPCLLKLRDGTLLCTSLRMGFFASGRYFPILKNLFFLVDGNAAFLGGYVLKSADNGKTWQGPIYPPHIDAEIHYSALGVPLPAYNRGALYEGESGRIFWVVAATDSQTPKKNFELFTCF